MVQAALQTGARYGELCQLGVHDLNPDAGTLAIRKRKSGKARHVILTEEGVSAIRPTLSWSRRPRTSAQAEDGQPFGAAHQARPMTEPASGATLNHASVFMAFAIPGHHYLLWRVCH